MSKTHHFDTIIIGAGAAGLMCAIEAGKRQRKVLIIDHSNKVGKKILMSGGGNCNFTNYHIHPECYSSHNPHFCQSALKRYTQWDFIALVEQYKIPYHEKTLGQLFCDNKSKDIVNMLLAECQKYRVTIQLNESIEAVNKIDTQFNLKSNKSNYTCHSLVIATGGLSIPTLGASPFGYKIAEQFGIKVYPTRAGLVPLTLHTHDKEKFSALSGISNMSIVKNSPHQFKENILFTHRGLSGPAILQISSFWQPGEALTINLTPDTNIKETLLNAKNKQPKQQLSSILTKLFAKNLVTTLFDNTLLKTTLGEISTKNIENIVENCTNFTIKPNGTEGYRTAEVTLGGVDCCAISSKTMEANQVKGLYFIGEVLDVAGWLGGYNFQWAWSSGWAAGQVV